MGLQKLTVPVCVFLVTLAAVCFTEPYSGEPSNRVTINLGETPWKFIKANPPTVKDSAFNDAAGKEVGIPYTWADTEDFLNEPSGGGDGSMEGGPFWYRKHFTLDSKYAGRRIFFECEGAHVGIQVYCNGTFMPGNSGANPNATHVVGFMGFVVDITGKVKFGGADNVIATCVSKAQGFYSDPGFSEIFRFGQGIPGMFRPVWLHITDPVHVPLNVYSCLNQWGTYVATETVADDGSSATVKIQTNVRNDGASAQTVTLTTKIVDAGKNVVMTLPDASQSIGAGQSYVFDQSATINNPKLWYPNNSPYGKPYMHNVFHIVKVNGATVDVFQSPLGIRVITWDKDFPYFNGHPMFLWGASARYDYPALATALPREIEWKDAKLLADIGGNLWRPGHSSCSKGFVEACDAYGIMLVQPSGEHEGACGGCNATVKSEVHRDMIIRDRNNPSILAWEVSNGPIGTGLAQQLQGLANQWDPIHTRVQADRTPNPANGYILGCTATGCEIGVKHNFPNNPAWGSEDWSNYGRLSRWGYDYEIAFIADYLAEWVQSQKNKCFGLAQWYMAETPGEDGFFLDMPNQKERSFGCSMMDFNRIPKFLYHAYRVCWSIKPQIAIAHHWNRSGNVRVNVFCNCDSVRLLINGKSQGVKKPNPSTGVDPDNDHTQNATQLPFQCYWQVAWESGTLRAEGLDKNGTVVCSDEKKTAGTPHHVLLTVEPPLVKPDGDTFKITANGSDVALILAKVVDADGNWCPTASGLITWNVTGNGLYRGGSDQIVDGSKPKTWHAPPDPELSIEGGMCKVAVRSTFTPGTVNVSATVANLPQQAASTSYVVGPVVPVGVQQPLGRVSPLQSAPVIIIESNGSGLRYFINKAGTVSVEILSAGGRVVAQVPVSRQAQGWHTLQLGGAGGDSRGNGVYFVRCSMDGGFRIVKRVVVVR
jgi:beta-galactosidase